MDILWGLLLLFYFITGAAGATTCELEYNILGFSGKAEFVCSGCCCGEPTTRHCCTCWWIYLIGPLCGLVALIVIAIIVVIVLKKKKSGQQGRVLPQGQVLHQPAGPGYSQTTMAVGGQSAPTGYPQPPPTNYPVKPQGQGADPNQQPTPAGY